MLLQGTTTTALLRLLFLVSTSAGVVDTGGTTLGHVGLIHCCTATNPAHCSEAALELARLAANFLRANKPPGWSLTIGVEMRLTFLKHDL
jgi:hypothetical protein